MLSPCFKEHFMYMYFKQYFGDQYDMPKETLGYEAVPSHIYILLNQDLPIQILQLVNSIFNNPDF